MQEFTICKKDGNQVACVSAVPAQMKGIVIAIHGFTSSKESPTYRLLLERLPLKALGVICIDLPGHGTAESAKELLRINGALDSIGAIERYAVSKYPGVPVCYFGSSFGAYLLGLYISTRDHAGRKVFWRSAAVNMPELFHTDPPTELEKKNLRSLEKEGYFDAAMEDHRPIRIVRAMYDDLMEHNLFDLFDPDRFGKHRIAMAHGSEDTVIDPDAAARFAQKFHIDVTWFPGEGHSLSKDPAAPDRVMELAVSLFTERGDAIG